MKKYITVATLLAAETIFANATATSANLGGVSGTWTKYNMQDSIQTGTDSISLPNTWGGATAWITLEDTLSFTTQDENRFLSFNYDYSYAGSNGIYSISFLGKGEDAAFAIGNTEYANRDLAAVSTTLGTVSPSVGYAQSIRFNPGNSADRFQQVSNTDTTVNLGNVSYGTVSAVIRYNNATSSYVMTLSSGDKSGTLDLGNSVSFSKISFSADGNNTQSFSNMSMATGITAHGVDFVAPSKGATIHSFISSTGNFYIDAVHYGNASEGTEFKGLYVTKNGGLKFNHSTNITVSYLYIDGNIEMCSGTDATAGKINWSNTNASTGFVIKNTPNAWVDINANYEKHIDVSNMESGAIYLNTDGALTLSSKLDTDVVVFATFAAEQFVDGYSRTLLSGDFSTWTGTVNILDASGNAIDAALYQIETTTTGLFVITAPIPEPSTFGLLAGIGALALVASRRRRNK